jgi:hypothetical protein
MAGQNRCRMHGGSAPQTRRRAEQRVVEMQAMKEVAKYGFAPVDSPIDELARLAGEAVEMRAFLLRRITSGEVSGAETGAYERWLDRCTTILSSMARLNIEERRFQLSQRQAAIVVAAMTRFVELLGQDPSDPGIRQTIVLALTEARDVDKALK